MKLLVNIALAYKEDAPQVIVNMTFSVYTYLFLVIYFVIFDFNIIDIISVLLLQLSDSLNPIVNFSHQELIIMQVLKRQDNYIMPNITIRSIRYRRTDP